jgi:ubiquinone/menaquinone biosynthesis C-methylase UbiE
MEKDKLNSSYDARFSEELGGSEYEDLLIALDYYDEFEAETGKALKQYIVEHCKDKTEIKVLEAGPGTGITTLELLKADPRVKVVSVDNEAKMLDAVKARFAKMEGVQERVDFVLSDILAFLEAQADESFDAFASVYTIHNFTPDFRRQVIGLIAKKLKKGGIFINGDKYAREEEKHRQDYDAEIRNYGKFDGAADKAEKVGDMTKATHLRKIKDEWVAHAAVDEQNRITVDEQNEMLEALGFENIQWGKRFDLVVTVSATKKK